MHLRTRWLSKCECAFVTSLRIQGPTFLPAISSYTSAFSAPFILFLAEHKPTTKCIQKHVQLCYVNINDNLFNYLFYYLFISLFYLIYRLHSASTQLCSTRTWLVITFRANQSRQVIDKTLAAFSRKNSLVSAQTWLAITFRPKTWLVGSKSNSQSRKVFIKLFFLRNAAIAQLLLNADHF